MACPGNAQRINQLRKQTPDISEGLINATYRWAVDSLMNVSKLTLSDAATQLYRFPLNLIVPR